MDPSHLALYNRLPVSLCPPCWSQRECIFATVFAGVSIPTTGYTAHGNRDRAHGEEGREEERERWMGEEEEEKQATCVKFA